jgi:putative NADPH-quinone reductase
MNILAINGSPHGKDGNTDLLLQCLLQGMKNAGAITETIYLNKLNIKHCIGCTNCWFKTPGKCIYNDDMAVLLEKRSKADLLIFATPLYVFSMTGLMKDFLDRGLPLALPFFEENISGNKLTIHPKRYPRTTPQKMLLVSSCAFPEEEHFRPLVDTFKHIAKEGNIEYLGEILKTASVLFQEKNMQAKVTAYCNDLHIAGEQLIRQGKIDTVLANKLREPWVSNDELRTIINKRFSSILDN